jgi:O-antigen ligase
MMIPLLETARPPLRGTYRPSLRTSVFRFVADLPKTYLLIAAFTLVPCLTGLVYWAEDQGRSPIKPRDFIVASSALMILAGVLRRPFISIPAPLLLIHPAMRLADAAFLERYTNTEYGAHATFVMNTASKTLVSAVCVFLLCDRHWRKMVVVIAGLVLAVVTFGIFVEAAGIIATTPIKGRFTGFLNHPNLAGITLVFMLAILYSLQTRFWINLAASIPALAAVGLTLSRSLLSITLFLFLCYVIVTLRRQFLALVLLLAILIPVAVFSGAMLETFVNSLSMTKNSDTAGRLTAILQLDFERIKSPERAKDLADGWDAALRGPLTGYGTGIHGEWFPHNMVVSQWLETGIIGVSFYLLPLFICLAQSLRRRGRGAYILIPAFLLVPTLDTLVEYSPYWLAMGTCMAMILPHRIVFFVRKPGSARQLSRGNGDHTPPSSAPAPSHTNG